MRGDEEKCEEWGNMYIFGNFKGDFAENIRKNADRQKIESNFDMKNIELSIRYEKISRLIEFFDYRTSLFLTILFSGWTRFCGHDTILANATENRLTFLFKADGGPAIEALNGFSISITRKTFYFQAIVILANSQLTAI